MSGKAIRSLTNLALPVLLAAFSIPAFAVDVTYTTYGTFSGSPTTANTTATLSNTNGNAGDTVTLANLTNSATITSQGQTGVNVNLGPASLQGVIGFTLKQTMGTGSVNAAGELFTINISQVANPGGPGSGTLDGTMTGTIGISGASSPNITFATTSLTLGSVTYSLLTPTFTFSAPNVNGIETASGFINVAVSPEPTFYSLTGVGFAGLILMAIRRKRQIAVS